MCANRKEQAGRIRVRFGRIRVRDSLHRARHEPLVFVFFFFCRLLVAGVCRQSRCCSLKCIRLMASRCPATGVRPTNGEICGRGGFIVLSFLLARSASCFNEGRLFTLSLVVPGCWPNKITPHMWVAEGQQCAYGLPQAHSNQRQCTVPLTHSWFLTSPQRLIRRHNWCAFFLTSSVRAMMY